MKDIRIKCPKCGWEPDESCLWMCSICNTKWNTFETAGQCPTCGKVYHETMCIRSKGGCRQMSLHSDWYVDHTTLKAKPVSKTLMFWKRQASLPVTESDKEWIEYALLVLDEIFNTEYFKSLVTITPDEKYFSRSFTGSEEDAEFIFKKLSSIMNIDALEIQLMFYSNKPIAFSEGIHTTLSDNLKGSWKSTSGKYVDNGLGNKQIWIESELLKDSVGLIATMAHELAHYKLLGEYRMVENNEFLTDLVALSFGFGIFMGNSFFKFAQWTGTTHQGWRMQKKGYLPEQVIAYAMAWLAHYRNEDISWKHYLNKTMKKYFEQSYEYIKQNNNLITWRLD